LSRIAEATADFRRSGLWSVYLGPPSPFRRLCWQLTDRQNQEHERRLGMLLVCIATALGSALTRVGIAYVGIKAHAKTSSIDGDMCTGTVHCRLCIETEAPLSRVQQTSDANVLSDPVAAALAERYARVNVALSVESPVSPPMA
jgi:hypothetical protein